MRSWIEFWDGEHAIYAGERHKQLNARWVARDLMRFVDSSDAVVLDFGCGEALSAGALAECCGKLILCDGAPSIRKSLAARFDREPGIVVAAPEDLNLLADRSLDVIVVNSVLQYLGRDQLCALLDLWREKLAEGGRLVLSDVIPPDVSKFRDAISLMHFAWRGGFVAAAVAGLVRTACSDYGRLRSEVGFSTYDQNEISVLLHRHGFDAERVFPNVGHNQSRMTFVATRRASVRRVADVLLQAAE